MSQAGTQMMNWLSLAHELESDWRYDIEGLDTHHRGMNDARNVAYIIKKMLGRLGQLGPLARRIAPPSR